MSRNTGKIRLDYKTKFKLKFFDTKEVKSKLDAGTRKVLSRFGAYTRSTAKRSIVKRKNAAPPWHPPHSHEGSLRRHIMFAYSEEKKSVVVGPVKLYTKKGEAPSLLEYGGIIQSHINKKRKDKKINGYGYIPAKGHKKSNRKVLIDLEGRRQSVIAVKITSNKMLEESEKIDERFFGPKIMQGKMMPRPYMGPAAKKEMTKLPMLWRTSIK